MLDMATQEKAKGTRARSSRPRGRKEVPTIRVALADGQTLVRTGMAQMLGDAENVEVVSTSSDLDEAVRHLRGHHPDVLVFDPAGDADLHLDREMMDALREASPETAVVVLSANSDADEARAALRSGASGFVAKNEDPGALLEAVKSAANGEPYINGRLAIEIARLEATEEADGLTERETEILRLIALGHTNAEIATMLYLSIRTVESHRAHILEKLRLASRAELVRYAIDHRLIP